MRRQLYVVTTYPAGGPPSAEEIRAFFGEVELLGYQTRHGEHFTTHVQISNPYTGQWALLRLEEVAEIGPDTKEPGSVGLFGEELPGDAP